MKESKKNTKIPDNFDAQHAEDSWSIFKIMGEFVEGYDKLFEIGPCVSMFGSSRLEEDDQYYQMASKIARRITHHGFGVITGGGPGIMEAANKGARQGKGKSVGVGISLPHEQGINDFVDQDYIIDFNYFFARKVMFVKYAQGFVVLPGGFGTLDEFFESMTLIQTKKISKFPIILLGTEYWGGLVDWIKTTLVEHGTISSDDVDLFKLTDDVDEAVETIVSFYEERSPSPNF